MAIMSADARQRFIDHIVNDHGCLDRDECERLLDRELIYVHDATHEAAWW